MKAKNQVNWQMMQKTDAVKISCVEFEEMLHITMICVATQPTSKLNF